MYQGLLALALWVMLGNLLSTGIGEERAVVLLRNGWARAWQWLRQVRPAVWQNALFFIGSDWEDTPQFRCWRRQRRRTWARRRCKGWRRISDRSPRWRRSRRTFCRPLEGADPFLELKQARVAAASPATEAAMPAPAGLAGQPAQQRGSPAEPGAEGTRPVNTSPAGILRLATETMMREAKGNRDRLDGQWAEMVNTTPRRLDSALNSALGALQIGNVSLKSRREKMQYSQVLQDWLRHRTEALRVQLRDCRVAIMDYDGALHQWSGSILSLERMLSSTGSLPAMDWGQSSAP